MAEDPWLDESHFSVTAMSDGFLVRDLGSGRGTFVRGASIDEAQLADGGEIVAGCTTFVVQRGEPAAAKPGDPRARRAFEALRAAPGQLYAVLDAARSIDVLRYRRESPDPGACLYDGPTALRLADTAPYVFALDREGSLLTTMLDEGWGDSRGIFLHAGAGLDVVRRHLRTLVYARSPSDTVVFFRFYDPRVLSAILPPTKARQSAELFGPIDGFLVEAREGNDLLYSTRTEAGAIVTHTITLDT